MSQRCVIVCNFCVLLSSNQVWSNPGVALFLGFLFTTVGVPLLELENDDVDVLVVADPEPELGLFETFD